VSHFSPTEERSLFLFVFLFFWLCPHSLHFTSAKMQKCKRVRARTKTKKEERKSKVQEALFSGFGNEGSIRVFQMFPETQKPFIL